MDAKALIKTENLSVGYPPSHILFKKLNISLQPGELVCFMGPNGIGKSTLIRTLAGLQKPLTGLISEVNERLIGIVLTDRISASYMSVQELVTFGRYPYVNWNISISEADERIINKAIDTVQLNHLLNKKLYELSDGQMQMAMIARALVQETPVLLLDEPTAHLDLNNRVKIMNLLRKLARLENKAILVATHELDLALQMADKIWLAMPDGSIKAGVPEDLVLDGSIDEVFQLKGFDLRTGKVEHEPYRGASVHLEGQGPIYLWTKNALERMGFSVSEKAPLEITIEQTERLTLRLGNKVYYNLKDLMEVLIQSKI